MVGGDYSLANYSDLWSAFVAVLLIADLAVLANLLVLVARIGLSLAFTTLAFVS